MEGEKGNQGFSEFRQANVFLTRLRENVDSGLYLKGRGSSAATQVRQSQWRLLGAGSIFRRQE